MTYSNLVAIKAGFPSGLTGLIDHILRYIKIDDTYAIRSEAYFRLENGESVSIPARILIDEYYGEKLKKTERAIYDSILSRSTNGYIREEAIRSLRESSKLPSWALPYLYLSLSDYAIEISSIVQPEDNVVEILRGLSRLNPEEYRLLRERVCSYWNEYYRDYFQEEDYPAYKILRLLSEE